MNKPVKARFLGILFFTIAGFSGCPAENYIHPDFTITKEMLIDALKDMADVDIREKILSQPGEFLDRIKLLLAEEQELLLLVDKKHPLEKNYTPGDLVGLDDYAVEKTRSGMSVRKKIIDDLLLMNDAAKKDTITLVIASAYRSYPNQEVVYAYWVKLLGEEQASRESAQAGHSQHQLGTTIDFNPIDDSFAATKAGMWLKTHAGDFGFSLSYPSGYEAATGYKYEPWHYRYVGRPACGIIDSYFPGVQQYLLEFYFQYADFFRQHMKNKK